MAKYVDGNLHGNEQVCYRGRVSWFAALHRGVILTVVALVVIGITEARGFLAVICTLALLLGLFGIVSGIVFILSAEYAVTDRRVIGKYGLIRHQSVDVLLTSISGATTSFTVLGRIFSYGSVWVNGNGTRRMLQDLSQPKAFESAIHERLEDSRLLKGTAAYTLNVQMAEPEGAPREANLPTAQMPPSPAIAASFCGQCGTAITEGAQFCGSCGTPA